MTTPPTPRDRATIGQLLAAAAPRGWREITYVRQSVGQAFVESMTCVRAADEVRVPPPDAREFFDLMADLRARMYQPGAGSWYTATIRVTADGRVSADFDHDEPAHDFGHASWAVDVASFPRTPENTPAWLVAKVSEPEWSGARWQIDLTPGGAPRDRSRPVDATTTLQGRTWCVAVAERLRVAGIGVRRGTDVGESAAGDAVEYDELAIDVGEGHMALAFWRDLIFWSVDVFADDVDEATFTSVARAVLVAVRDTTGHAPSVPPSSYERRLLGLED
ncbi:hypothetical protein OMK64_06180 [Cellulomonas fimi]|uniref:hypothetical protein n=1 Tax=Cellulomonas fimi TaxID=1708 RepID=UPI00234D9890|nr:hypothetical protein [Cellulomonas fimi]MDC7121121.1 hypothetical protein [Cellulomonas fimi]